MMSGNEDIITHGALGFFFQGKENQPRKKKKQKTYTK